MRNIGSIFDETLNDLSKKKIWTSVCYDCRAGSARLVLGKGDQQTIRAKVMAAVLNKNRIVQDQITYSTFDHLG